MLLLVLGVQFGEVALSYSLLLREEMGLVGLALGLGVLEGNQFAGVEEVLLGVDDGAEGLRIEFSALFVHLFEL